MLTALRTRFGMMTEIPPNQQSVGPSCNPYYTHRPEGRLIPADKRKKESFFIRSPENLASIPVGYNIQKSVQI